MTEPGSRYPFGGEIIITERLWRFYIRDVAKLVARVMRAAGCTADVVLTDDLTVQRLNRRDRRRNKPTNVLTYEQPPEILLAFGVVRFEAMAAQKPLAAHLAHLLVHGALHLQGFDHQHAGQARRMEGQETKLLARLGVPNPWKNR